MLIYMHVLPLFLTVLMARFAFLAAEMAHELKLSNRNHK